MKPHSRILSLLTIVLIASLTIGACSDDPTGPDPTGPAIKMKLTYGAFFDSKRWDLDKNNQKVGDPVMYRITYNRATPSPVISGFDDYVKLKETNLVTMQSSPQDEWAPMRIEQNGNLYIYGFQHRLYNYFFDLIKQLDPTVDVPPIVKTGYKKWDLLADFNDADGKANVKGHTWTISDEGIEPFNFSVDIGLPNRLLVTVFPEISGVYDGVVQSMNIKNADVTRWQVRILITMKLRSQILDKDITFNQTLTYSDKPSGQITLLRESAVFDLSDFGGSEVVLAGEQRELTTYVVD